MLSWNNSNTIIPPNKIMLLKCRLLIIAYVSIHCCANHPVSSKSRQAY